MDWMRLPWLRLTRCDSSRPRETGRRWIRQQLCTWYFNWRTETGDNGYAEGDERVYDSVYRHYELDGFGSAGINTNHDGSGPAIGVHAAEPTAGCGYTAGPVSGKPDPVRSGSDQSGAADHHGSGCRPCDHAREGVDQVLGPAHPNCGDLSAESDAGSAARAGSAG